MERKSSTDILLSTIGRYDRGELISVRSVNNTDSKEVENTLIETIQSGNLDIISRDLTIRTLTECESDLLTMGMKVISELRFLREDKERPDEEDIIKLENAVEEFIMRLLNLLKTDKRNAMAFQRRMDAIMDFAIDLKLKKLFTAIHLIRYRWYGRYSPAITWTWLFLHIWCIFDLMLFPIPFALLYINRLCRGTPVPLDALDIYKDFFTTPYFVFVRDTLSYLALLGLNIAICFAPSSIAFSGLEWVVLVFFIGRLLVEIKQIRDMKVHHILSQGSQRLPAASLRKLKFKRYLSDRWNRLDFTSLLVYLITYILRIVTWVVSESVTHNRALVIAGYFYGFNTMIFTFRTVGQLSEVSSRFGTIHIALFNIMVNLVAIIVQFIASILAVSFAITKVYVAEKSFMADEHNDNQLACTTTGISCWWMVLKHLAWSLLGVVELDAFNSVDGLSVQAVRMLYAFFLIMGVVLLINMLIALLSNTYTRVEDNALKEWSFKKAVRVQTYRDYHPIPVPWNIISIPVMALWYRVYPKEKHSESHTLSEIVADLKKQYLAKYGYSLPRKGVDDKKLDHVVSMVNQITKTTFKADCDQGPYLTGPQWEISEGVHVEGCLLMCDGTAYCGKCWGEPYGNHTYGARYLAPFSPVFPYFEVFIQEIGETSWLGVGLVTKDYDKHKMPGWEQKSVGYHTDDGNIFDESFPKHTGFMARQGDLIGCTVMFEEPNQEENQLQKKAKVVFRLNGNKITQDEILIDYKPGENLYPYIGLKHKRTKVLAKMRAEETEYLRGKNPQRGHLESNALEELKLELARIRTEMQTEMARTKVSLDAVLEKLTELENNVVLRASPKRRTSWV